MTYFDKKESSQTKNYLLDLENDNRAFESEKEALFKESSSEIHYLIRQLNKLAGLFEEKNVGFESFKKESGNWTASTQRSKGNVFRTTQFTVKPKNQTGYSDQTLRQKLDQLIQRHFLLEQKIQLFIKRNGERKQNLQQLKQRQNQLKQQNQFIQQLQKALQLEKQKHKQVEAQFIQNQKLQKNKLESQYNKKISQIKQDHEQKNLQNIRKYQSIVQLLQKEKDRIFSFMESEISTLQKNYELKMKENRLKSPKKTRKISLEYGMKFKNTSQQKSKQQCTQKQNHQNEQKLKKANQKIHDFQQIAKKYQTQMLKLKEQNVKLKTRFQCYQIKNKQQMDIIQEKQNFIIQKSLEISKISQELEEKTQSYLRLEKTLKSLQAKIANLTQELKRSKKATEEIRQLSNRNTKNLEKQLEDMRRQLLESKKAYFNLNSQLETVKHQIKQKEIRIQSMDRQLQRTKNYNEILTKQNLALNQTIEGIGQNKPSDTLLKIPSLFKESLKELKSPRKFNQNKSLPTQLILHSKSLHNIHQIESENCSQVKPKIDASRFNRMSSQSLTEVHRQNVLNREMILPLNDLKNSFTGNLKQSSGSNQANSMFQYNSFETTFSPFISPIVSEQNTALNSMAQAEPTNILSWNPESPINEMQSLYNSLNERIQQNRQDHVLRSDELIEKMSSLSKQKDRKQTNESNRTAFGMSSMEFGKNRKKLQEGETTGQIKAPRLKPLSRLGFQGTKDGKQSTSPSQDKVLNLSFEQNNLYSRSAFYNKKMITSSGKLETHKGGLKEFK